MHPNKSFKAIFMAMLMSILTILLMNIMLIASGYLVIFLLIFHASRHAANADRFPVSFLSRHRAMVKSVIKWRYFAGTLLTLYGLWLG